MSAQGRGFRRSRHRIRFSDYFRQWIGDDSAKQIALLGDYGQGKSSEALALTRRLLVNSSFFLQRGFRLPLLIRLTGLSPKTSSPEEFLGAWGARHGLNGRALLALHRAGRLILIFDAFDEMANVSDRADRFDHFSMLWRFAYPGAKIIFTGRPNFFLDDEELKRTLGIAEGLAVGPYCAAMRIAPFNDRQIEGALRWLSRKRVKNFMNALRQSPVLSELAARPSLLFQLAQLWHKHKLSLESKTLSSATVTRAFITYSLERQVEKQRIDVASPQRDKQFLLLRLSELQLFTQALALSALVDGRNNAIPESVLSRTVDRLLREISDTDYPRKTVETGALSMPLKTRLQDKPNRIEAVVHAVRTHGVIELDPAKSSHYRFSHKSFAEVLAAEVLVDAAAGNSNPAIRPFTMSQRRNLAAQTAVFWFSGDLASDHGASGTQISAKSILAVFYPRALHFAAWCAYIAVVVFGAVAVAVFDPLERLLSTALKLLNRAFFLPIRFLHSIDLGSNGVSTPEYDDVSQDTDEETLEVSLHELEDRYSRQLRRWASGFVGALIAGIGFAIFSNFYFDLNKISLDKIFLVGTAALPMVAAAFIMTLLSRANVTPFNETLQFTYMLEKIGRLQGGSGGAALSSRFTGRNLLDSLVERKLTLAELRLDGRTA